MGKSSGATDSSKTCDQKLNRVAPYMFFGKSSPPSIRQEGYPFFVQKNMTEKKTPSAGHHSVVRTAENAELCKRPAVGLSIAAATAEAALTSLQKCMGVDGSLSKLGFKQLLDMVDAAEGHGVPEHREREDMTTADVEQHVTGVVNFLSTASDFQAEVLRKVAMSASLLYMGPISLLELTSLVNDRATWADSVEKKAASAELKAWMNDAKSVKKLAAAIASGYKSRADAKKSRKRKASVVSDEESDNDDGNESSPASSSKKSKKGKKEADNSKAKSSKRQSSSSSGSSTKSKKAKKAKKDKKDDKKKRMKKIRIDFGSEDEEEKKAEEAEKAHQADILKTWPTDSVEKFKETLERIEDDTNHCPFVDFLKMLGDIPNDVVIMLDFKETRDQLSKKKKFPKITCAELKGLWLPICEDDLAAQGGAGRVGCSSCWTCLDSTESECVCVTYSSACSEESRWQQEHDTLTGFFLWLGPFPTND